MAADQIDPGPCSRFVPEAPNTCKADPVDLTPRRLAPLLLSALLLASACSRPGIAGDSKPAARDSLAAAVKKLPVKPAQPSGYRREKFDLWVDQDHDGCNTRKEVLLQEATKKPRKGADCKLTGGAWRSYYDDKTVSRDRQLDIDHVVPLGEAWASGASTWSAAKRERYANDLGARQTLVAVSPGPNRAKGDRDPAGWMPPAKSAYCRYATDWVDTKLRWGLAVDNAERSKLASLARSCPKAKVDYTPAT